MLRMILIWALLVVASVSAEAQSGVSFSELRTRLAPYFADELIDDLQESMPKGSEYRVWGWDVGDFTGDGNLDVAFSINVLGMRRKECVVYLFADVDGFLVNVASYRVPYVTLPLEVGVVIKNTTCYVAQKRKDEDWTMTGYRFVGGSVVKVDDFVTNTVQAFAHESYRNYQSLETSERYVLQSKPTFQTSFITIPCYERGRQVFAGIVPEATVGTIEHVRSGSFWWSDANDASFRARLVYDDQFLYVRVAVQDSHVVTGWCDTCPADRLELWFDVTPPADESNGRYLSKVSGKTLKVRSEADSGLYAFSVTIGDFQDVRPTVKVRTTDELSAVQDEAASQVRVVTSQRSDGYIVKVRIPFTLLGYDRPPLREQQLTELGCTIALYDVDNDFRADEVTMVASSAIQPMNPSTYGSLCFVPTGLWYGETSNIFADDVLNSLRELGF